MTIALIIICIIAIGCIELKIASKIPAKKAKIRLDRMTPGELRKAQEAAYRQQAYSNA